MQSQTSKSVTFLILAGMLLWLSISSCGVLEIGIERTATPAPTTPAEPPVAASPTPKPIYIKAGLAVKLIQIHMLTEKEGWGIGQVETDLNDHILYTQDGGRTWLERTPPAALVNAPDEGLAALAYFAKDGSAWVIYSANAQVYPPPEKYAVWFSKTKGTDWQLAGEVPLTGLQADYFMPANMGFDDDQHGWLMAHVGAGMSHDYIVAFITADGGKTWQVVIDPLSNPNLMACAKTGFGFSSAANGWLAGDCPERMGGLFFYTTRDGGQTWQEVAPMPPENQPDDFFSAGNAICGTPAIPYLAARTSYFVVRCQFLANGDYSSWLYDSIGENMADARPLPLPFGAIQFIDSQTGWMIGSEKNDPGGAGEIYRTTDGGQTWDLVITTGWQGMPDFIDANTGWVIARQADKTALVFTSNGGVLWEVLYPVIGK